MQCAHYVGRAVINFEIQSTMFRKNTTTVVCQALYLLKLTDQTKDSLTLHLEPLFITDSSLPEALQSFAKALCDILHTCFSNPFAKSFVKFFTSPFTMSFANTFTKSFTNPSQKHGGHWFSFGYMRYDSICGERKNDSFLE